MYAIPYLCPRPSPDQLRSVSADFGELAAISRLKIKVSVHTDVV